jgi:hypothetical protein
MTSLGGVRHYRPWRPSYPGKCKLRAPWAFRHPGRLPEGEGARSDFGATFTVT